MERRDVIAIAAISIVALLGALVAGFLVRPGTGTPSRYAIPTTPVLSDPPRHHATAPYNLELEVRDAFTGTRIESGTVVTIRSDSGFHLALTGQADGNPLRAMVPEGPLSLEFWRERCVPVTIAAQGSGQTQVVSAEMHVSRRVQVQCQAPCWVVVYSDAPPVWPRTHPFSRAVYAVDGNAEFWLTPGSYWCAVAPAGLEVSEARLAALTLPAGSEVMPLEVGEGALEVSAPGPEPAPKLGLSIKLSAPESAWARSVTVNVALVGPGPLRRWVSSHVARTGDTLDLANLAPGVYLVEGLSPSIHGQAVVDTARSAEVVLNLHPIDVVATAPHTVGSIRILKFGKPVPGIFLWTIAWSGQSDQHGRAPEPPIFNDPDRPRGGITWRVPARDPETLFGSFGRASDSEGLVRAPMQTAGPYTVAAQPHGQVELKVVFDPRSHATAEYELCPPGTGALRVEGVPEGTGQSYVLLHPEDGFMIANLAQECGGLPAGEYIVLAVNAVGNQGEPALPHSWPVTVKDGEVTTFTPEFRIRRVSCAWPEGLGARDGLLVTGSVAAYHSTRALDASSLAAERLVLENVPASALRLSLEVQSRVVAWADLPAGGDLTEVRWQHGPAPEISPRLRCQWHDYLRSTFGPQPIVRDRSAKLPTPELPPPGDLPQILPNTGDTEWPTSAPAVLVYLSGADSADLWRAALTVSALDFAGGEFAFDQAPFRRPRLVQREGRLALAFPRDFAGSVILEMPDGRRTIVAIPAGQDFAVAALPPR